MWDKRDLLDINSLSREEIELILHYTGILEPFSGRGNKLNICKGEILITAFFEPSTRTEMSFATAMHTLGGDVQCFKPSGSSIEKGESKEDTVQILEQYCDILVIRDPEIDSVKRYADLVNIPVINAGDGSNEHPTQALLDLYTIWKKFNTINGLRMAIIGDLRYGRNLHSLVEIFGKFDNNKIIGISPPGLELPNNFKTEDFKGIITEMDKLDEILAEIRPDIVYAGRLRKEYLPLGENPMKYKYEINRDILENLSEKTIVMHALPRVDELNPEVDSDPRFIPFKQARYGLQTRMAIIALLLGHEKELMISNEELPTN